MDGNTAVKEPINMEGENEGEKQKLMKMVEEIVIFKYGLINNPQLLTKILRATNKAISNYKSEGTIKLMGKEVQQFDKVKRMLKDMGFKVTWADIPGGKVINVQYRRSLKNLADNTDYLIEKVYHNYERQYSIAKPIADELTEKVMKKITQQPMAGSVKMNPKEMREYIHNYILANVLGNMTEYMVYAGAGARELGYITSVDVKVGNRVIFITPSVENEHVFQSIKIPLSKLH